MDAMKHEKLDLPDDPEFGWGFWHMLAIQVLIVYGVFNILLYVAALMSHWKHFHA